VYYNIGAGSFRHKDWINIDHSSDWYSGVQGEMIEWNLLELSPIKIISNSADLLYSSHVIEHVTDEAVQNLCNEMYRVLKPNSVARIQAPNVDIFYNNFKKNNITSWLANKNPSMSKIPLGNVSPAQAFVWAFASNATNIHRDGANKRLTDDMINKAFFEKDYVDALNYCTSFVSLEKQKKYPGNHMNWWNPTKIISMLEEVGFSEVYESHFGESKAIEMRDTKYFDFGHKGISFYVEARK